MYGISNGTQPMRSRNMIPHDKIKYYPDLLKKAGSKFTMNELSLKKPSQFLWVI